MNDDGTMKRGKELFAFAREHNIKIGTIAELIRYRFSNEHSVERIADQNISTEYGDFRMVVYEDQIDKTVHLALVKGQIGAEKPTLVRVHLRNTLQDVTAVTHAHFGWPLRSAMQRIAKEGEGVVVILRKPETPRELVQQIVSLTEAAKEHAEEEDSNVLRTYGIGAQILSDLGVKKMRVLSAPKRMQGISGFGLEVSEYVHCE